MIKKHLIYETEAKNQGFRFILGVDEAGRGPLAGPVVAAAVCLKNSDFDCRIDDSKKLTSNARNQAFHEIHQKAYVGIGMVSEVAIDHINILNATFAAMDAAIEQLMKQIHKNESQVIEKDIKILIDGHMFRTTSSYAYRPIIDGDCLSLSIACASIIAKTYRDRIMETYDRILPQYGFKDHKGYGTKFHREAITKFGPSIIHRKSFHWTL